MRIKVITGAHNLTDKRVLTRVDFNVAMKKNKIIEDFKITANLPLIKYLVKKKAKVLLISHLGEPQFTKAGAVKNRADFSLKPIANNLSKKLGTKVLFLEEAIGSKKLAEKIKAAKDGQVILLENLRFYPGEVKNDRKFGKQLAGLADIYVNNAFAVSHRNHASVSRVKNYITGYAGTLVEEEVLALSKVLHPAKPFVAVIGGAKIDTKVALLKHLSIKADFILAGGAVANCFLAARGFRIGKSLATPADIALARRIDNKKKIILPVDVLVADKNFKNVEVKSIKNIGAKDCIFDIGPETMKMFAKHLRHAQTIVWNGPVGLFEEPHFRQGTLFIGRAIAEHTKGKAYGVVGGGETIEALRLTKMIEYVDWVSTGGGASISYLGGEKMPGLKGLVN